MLSIKHPDYRILPAALFTPFIFAALFGTSASADDAVEQRKNNMLPLISLGRGASKRSRERRILHEEAFV